MKKFIIEREVPGAGAMSADELRGVACTSNAVLKEMDAPYHWVQTFVTGDKMYCVHIAPDEETVRGDVDAAASPSTASRRSAPSSTRRPRCSPRRWRRPLVLNDAGPLEPGAAPRRLRASDSRAGLGRGDRSAS